MQHATPLGQTAPIMPEDGYLACIELSDCHSRELWLDGKAVQTHPLAVGDVVFHDLRRNPILNFRSPFHSLNFYLPRAVVHIPSPTTQITFTG